MTAQSKIEAAPEAAGLAKLREKFPPNAISKLPKETGAQAKQRKADQEKGNWPAKCAICEGYHHPRAVHLDYVGHAAATDRLLDTDLKWNWEPFAVDQRGLPAFDENGGLWIRLTVCGVTRIGYGSADGKSGGDAKKEIIGDALRNAGMRFGMALDLWHKGNLHADDDDQNGHGQPKPDPVADAPEGTFISDDQRDRIVTMAKAAGVSLQKICDRYGIENLKQLHADTFEGVLEALRASSARKAKPEPAPAGDILDDEVIY